MDRDVWVVVASTTELVTSALSSRVPSFSHEKDMGLGKAIILHVSAVEAPMETSRLPEPEVT